MQKVFTLETNKYSIRIENFEGPLDLLCHLIEVNKMDIYDVNINEITDQYIAYINKMEEMDLEVTSEFLIMASNLLYIKSKKLLPRQESDEEMMTEEQLIERIIQYKQYKEITNNFKELFNLGCKSFYRNIPEKIELPKQELQVEIDYSVIVELYKNIVNRNKEKVNKNAKNIEKIAVIDNYTVADTVKTMFRVLVKNKRFTFNKLFSKKNCEPQEVVTAFSGLLEMSRRDKVETQQEELFGDIEVTKKCKAKK